MKLNKIKKIIITAAVISSFLTITACRDSSIDDDFAEASLLSTSAVSPSSVSTPEEDVSVQQSIADSTTQPALSEITISKDLTGTIDIDGSALMSAISDKIAEQFRKACPKMTIKTGLSGTNEGISKFIEQKLDICNTSRPLSNSEIEKARSGGSDFVEIKVAYDGVVVVVDKSNQADTISLNEIKSIWGPESSIINWNEVNAKWPDKDLMVFGPKADTGLIEFFTKNILKTTDNQIGVYTEVNSDKELVKSISGDGTAIGITNFANYFNAKDKLKALKVDFGSGAVVPDVENIKTGKYQQLSSPMYLYVSKAAIQRAEVKAFVKYYLENASKTVTEAGYVPLSDKDYQAQLANIQ